MTEMRELGSSGLTISPLVLGGNTFGWTADRAASFSVLDAFVDGGGTMIDTADVYSAWIPGNQGGESETLIGEWLKATGKRDRVLIATKVGKMPGGGLRPDQVAEGVEDSLRRLGTDRIDLYFAHRDDEDVPLEDTLGAFARLVEAGKVRAIGASNYGAMRLKEAIDTAARIGVPHFSVLQNEYNLVSRHRFEGEVQDLVITHNIGSIPFYGLASGFLTGKYRDIADTRDKARGGTAAKHLESAAGRAVLAAMDEVVAETGASHAQVALAWLAAQPGVTAPIASATTAEQVQDLLGAMTLTLDEEQLARLDVATG